MRLKLRGTSLINFPGQVGFPVSVPVTRVCCQPLCSMNVHFIARPQSTLGCLAGLLTGPPHLQPSPCKRSNLTTKGSCEWWPTPFSPSRNTRATMAGTERGQTPKSAMLCVVLFHLHQQNWPTELEVSWVAGGERWREGVVIRGGLEGPPEVLAMFLIWMGVCFVIMN